VESLSPETTVKNQPSRGFCAGERSRRVRASNSLPHRLSGAPHDDRHDDRRHLPPADTGNRRHWGE
jgi:hypothetical protein